MARSPSDLVRFEPRDSVLIATALTSSIMGEDGTAIGNEIIDEVQASGGAVRTVVLDMSGVNSVNSVLLGSLVTVKTTLMRYRVEFALLGVRDAIGELLASTKLERVFVIIDTLRDLDG